MTTYNWNLTTGGAWGTTTNWTPTAPTGGPGSTDTAVFSQNITANANITLPATITAQTISAQDITVNSNAWFIGQTGVSNSWAPGVNAIFTVPLLQSAPAYVLYFYARLTGSVDFKKTGAGAAALGSPNAGTHNPTSITIQDGLVFSASTIAATTTLNFGESGIVPPSGTAAFDSGSSITQTFGGPANINQNFTFQGSSLSTGTLTLSGAVNFGGTQRTLTVTNGPVTVSGVLSGTAGFVKAGTNTLTLSSTSASNALSGTVTVSGGTLSVSTTSLQDAIWDSGGAGTTTFAASSKLGGITGSGNFSFTTALTLGGVGTNVSATWTGGFITNNITLTKAGTGTQQLGGNSTGRTSAATNINAGAIQLNSSNGLYAAGATGTTTVSQNGAGLWLNGGGVSTPTGNGLTISGTGVSVDGALRNVTGSNTYGGTITTGASTTIRSDAGTLTTNGITVSDATTLTLDTVPGAAILLNGVASGSGTSKIIVSGAGTTKAGTTNVFAATANVITGTFDINGNAQTIASGKTLDGTGTFTGAVTMASGSTLKAGNGAGGATFSLTDTLTFGAGTETMTLYKDSGTLSKVAVTNALTLTGTVTLNASSTSWVSGSTHTFLTYGSKTGAGSFTAGTLTGGTGRQSIGNITVGSTAATFDVLVSAASVKWNGGDSGNWYNGETTGWTGTGVTDFANGDTVTFDTTSTATATLTGDVTVASMTMNAADHVIGGSSRTLTNNTTLTISDAFTQTLNCTATHGGNITLNANASLTVGNNALGGAGTGLSFAGANTLTANVSVSTSRNVTLPAAASTTLTKNNDATLTLSGSISGSSNFVIVRGAGILYLQGSNSFAAVMQVSDSSVAVGKNVLRADFDTALSTSSGVRMDYGAVCESSVNVTRAYGAATGQIIAGNVAGGGGGFSAYNASGISITNNGSTLTFGTNSSTQWYGPMYFGTAYNTALGLTKFTCAMNLNAQSQTFHVFLGSSSVDYGGEISGKISGTGTFTKAGPGTLTLSNSTNDYSATNAVTAGTLKATSKTALGTGAVTMSASAKLQATDTSTATVLATGSFTSASGARLILGS